MMMVIKKLYIIDKNIKKLSYSYSKNRNLYWLLSKTKYIVFHVIMAVSYFIKII